MIMKANKQIGFIYKNNESIDKILKDGEVVFERGFLREKTSTTLPINFGSVGKDLKDYRVYGNTVQNGTPTPDAPIEMVSCGDRTNNLFDKSTALVGYRITVSGINEQSNTACSDFIKVEEGINLSASNKSPATNYYFYDETKTFISYVSGFQATVPENAKYVRVNLDVDALDSYMLNVGSTALPYEPYGYKIPVNVRSENLFDISNVTNVDNGSISDGLITSISFTYNTVQNIRPRFSVPFPFKTGTYYISADIRRKSGTGGLNKINDGFNDYTKVVFPSLTNEFQRYVVRHQYNSDTSYSDGRLLFQIATNSNNLVLEIKNIMISTSNDYIYAPYYNETTNIYLDEPLRKIDEYSDYIDFINQKVVRRIKETLLDDNITWTTNQFANEKRIYTSSSNIDSNMRAVNLNSQVGYLLSNQYKAEKLENILALSVRYGIGISSSSYFSILNQDYASATDFLQALHDNPIVLDYVLRFPTEETITLPNIPTIDGNNTLNIETEITPSQVYIKYKSNE